MAAQISYQPSVLHVGNVAFRGAAAELPVHDDVFNGASVALRDSRQQPLLALVQRQINGDMDATINRLGPLSRLDGLVLAAQKELFN
jgi:hypothetical protein